MKILFVRKHVVSLILLVSLFCLPCIAKDKCRLHVSLPASTQGGQADLTDFDILSFAIFDSIDFKGSEFYTNIECREQPYLAMIRVHTDDLRTGVFFIVEKGRVNIVLNSQYDKIVGGTSLNDLYYKDVTRPKMLIPRELNGLYKAREKELAAQTWTDENQAEYIRSITTPSVRDAHQKEHNFMMTHMYLPGVVGEYVLGRWPIEKPDLAVWPREYADFVEFKWTEMDALMKKQWLESGLSENDITKLLEFLHGQ